MFKIVNISRSIQIEALNIFFEPMFVMLINIKELSDVEKEFKQITGLQNVSVVSEADESIARFGIKGKLTTGDFDKELNGIIKKLNKLKMFLLNMMMVLDLNLVLKNYKN